MARHAVPYADVTSLTVEEGPRFIEKNEPVVFGHTLEDQIGGQLEAGFVPDWTLRRSQPKASAVKFVPAFIATRAVKTCTPSPG